MSAATVQRDVQFKLDWSAKLPAAAQAEIADGMRRADEHANLRWRHVFDACVVAAARKHPEITSDDVLCEIEEIRRRALVRLLGERGVSLNPAAPLAELEQACAENLVEPPADIPPSTHNLAAIGPAMSRAKEMGVLSPTDRVVRSKRAGKNGNRHNVWLSNYYGK